MRVQFGTLRVMLREFRRIGAREQRLQLEDLQATTSSFSVTTSKLEAMEPKAIEEGVYIAHRTRTNHCLSQRL